MSFISPLISSALWNNTPLLNLVIGGGMAFLINKVAHQILELQRNSMGSTLVTISCFAIGILISASLPFPAIATFTLLEGLKIGGYALVIGFMLTLGFQLIRFPCVGPLTAIFLLSGGMMGLVQRIVPISPILGILGAGFGTLSAADEV